MADYDPPYSKNLMYDEGRPGPFVDTQVYVSGGSGEPMMYASKIMLPHMCDGWMIGERADLELFIEDCKAFLANLNEELFPK